jgi:acyl carrier protein
MNHSREAILDDVMALLQQLADDWEYEGKITESTRLFADMGFQSMDVVVLGTAVQEKYRQILPFTDLFAEVGQRENHDLSIGELSDFLYIHLNAEQAEKLERVAAL